MSQTDLIHEHLKAGKEITPLEALQLFGCLRLAARIRELKDRGLDIEKEDVKRNGKTYASYRLKREKQILIFE